MSFRERIESIGAAMLAAVALLLLGPLFMFAFVVALLWHEPRTAIALAIALLVCTAVCLAAGGTGVADGLAVGAYLLLAAGVIFILVRHVSERGQGEGKSR